MFRFDHACMEAAMATSDGWTDDHIDTAINLLVRAERIVREIDDQLYDEIQRFLTERA